jgi:hypothetical protein
LQLFDEQDKKRQLSYLDLERLSKQSNSAEYKDAQRLAAQITTVWAGQALKENNFYPMATAIEVYGIVMQELGLANPYL